MSERSDPAEDVRRLYEDAEKRTAAAMEGLVKRDAFGELLARATENVLALTRIGDESPISWCATCGWPGGVTSPRWRASSRAPRTSSSWCCRRSSGCRRSWRRVRSARAASTAARRRRRRERVVGGRVNPSSSWRARRSRRSSSPTSLLTRDDAPIGVDAQGRGLDAPQDDALPLPLHAAHAAGAGAARLRADQPARHLRPAAGQLVRRVPARRGLRRLPARLGRARRRGRRHRPGQLRLRRAAVGDARDAARVRPGGAEPARLVHRRHRSWRCTRRSNPDGPARNLVLLTTPVDTTGSLYANWVARDSFDLEFVTEVLPLGARRRRRLGQQDDEAGHELLDDLPHAVAQRARPARRDREAYQAMAKWVADNPPFPGRAYREWITWMYKDNRLVARRPAPARPARRPAPDRAEPARRHRRRRPHRAPRRAPCRCSTWSPARTSPTSTAPAATSA